MSDKILETERTFLKLVEKSLFDSAHFTDEDKQFILECAKSDTFDVNTTTARGMNTALHLLVQKTLPKNNEIIDALLSNPATNVSQKNSNGKTPMDMAKMYSKRVHQLKLRRAIFLQSRKENQLLHQQALERIRQFKQNSGYTQSQLPITGKKNGARD